MTTKITQGPQTKNAQGKLGNRVFMAVQTRQRRWHGYPSFDTHGMTAEQTAAKIAAFEARLEKWSARMDGFQALLGVEMFDGVNGDLFRIVDCTIPSRTIDEGAYLVLGVRQIVDETLRKVEGWPLWVYFRTMDEVWGNARIIDEVRQRLEQRRERRTAHNAYTNKVASLVSGREG